MKGCPNDKTPFIPSVLIKFPVNILAEAKAPAIPGRPIQVDCNLAALYLTTTLSSGEVGLFSPIVFAPVFPESHHLDPSIFGNQVLPSLNHPSNVLFFKFTIGDVVKVLTFP